MWSCTRVCRATAGSKFELDSCATVLGTEASAASDIPKLHDTVEDVVTSQANCKRTECIAGTLNVLLALAVASFARFLLSFHWIRRGRKRAEETLTRASSLWSRIVASPDLISSCLVRNVCEAFSSDSDIVTCLSVQDPWYVAALWLLNICSGSNGTEMCPDGFLFHCL